MSSSKLTLTIRHLLCYTFIFGAFFHDFSRGIQWIQTPEVKTYSQIGKRVTLRWHYNLNHTKNESHYSSDLIFNDEDLANRQRVGEFSKRGYLGMFSVNGTNDVFFTLFDAQASFDGTFCLKVSYDINAISAGLLINCTELLTFAYPLVDVSPVRMVLNVTDQVHLYCNATGKPEPDITWKKADDLSIILSSSNWLNLSDTKPSDQGVYICIANNSFGTDNKTFFVEVQYKPEIQFISEDQIIPKGSTVLLQCNATGNPIPNVTWESKNNVGTALVSGHGNVTMQFTNISRADAGDYHCKATNMLGMTSNSTSITVQYRPIKTQMEVEPGSRVIIGRELILNCTSLGLPKINLFQFHLNGSLVENATNGVLRIKNITSSKSGEYKCVPFNELGKGVTAIVVIDVLVPPSFDQSINGSVVINESDTLELSCKARGNPPPVITWTKNLEHLHQDNIFRKENMSRDDAGLYRCTANNSVLNPVWSEATVIVNYAPEIVHITARKTVNETDFVSLKCNASGIPFPRVQWSKGNESLGNVSVGYTSESLASVTRKDTGEYTCKAVNLLGTKYNTTDITVQYKPIDTKLTTHNGKHEVAVNETLLLSCRAQALPHADWFTFLSKNRTLQRSRNSTYTIKKQTWSPTEEYTCMPENILGTGTPSSINISFLEQPSFTYQPKRNQKVNETDTIKLECLVEGKPKPSVKWTREGSSDVISTEEVLIKNNTIRNDAGTYRCTASNGVGQEIEAVFTVVVNYKPINTSLISTTGREGVAINESLTLKCSAQSVPSPHTFRFKVNGTTLNYTSSNGTLVVSKNLPFYDENYTCVATNLLGEGKESNTLTITMLEPAMIYNATGNVTVDENKTMTLECRAYGKPKPNVTWTKGDSGKIIGTSETYIKARAEKCDSGIYKCTADNGVRKPASAQATVTVKSYPGPPNILHIAISIPRIEVHWEQPAANCSFPITGYIAQVRKKENQGEWTECEAKREKTFWTCSFGELESSTTYTLQIIAKNRFGNGIPAEIDFKTKEKNSLPGSTDASKGGLSKKSYIIIGACIGGLFLLIIVVMVVKKFRTKHGENTLQTPIELGEPRGGQPNSTLKTELQNGYDGPMSASQETLDVKETEDVVEVEVKDSVEDDKL